MPSSLPDREASDLTQEDPDLDVIFHALSDTNRRRILALLREATTLRVSDIASAFEMSLNGVSKHLKTLEKAGLIRRRVQGREHWLHPCPERLALAARYFDVVEHFWHERLRTLDDQLTKTTKEEP